MTITILPHNMHSFHSPFQIWREDQTIADNGHGLSSICKKITNCPKSITQIDRPLFCSRDADLYKLLYIHVLSCIMISANPWKNTRTKRQTGLPSTTMLIDLFRRLFLTSSLGDFESTMTRISVFSFEPSLPISQSYVD